MVFCGVVSALISTYQYFELKPATVKLDPSLTANVPLTSKIYLPKFDLPPDRMVTLPDGKKMLLENTTTVPITYVLDNGKEIKVEKAEIKNNEMQMLVAQMPLKVYYKSSNPTVFHYEKDRPMPLVWITIAIFFSGVFWLALKLLKQGQTNGN